MKFLTLSLYLIFLSLMVSCASRPPEVRHHVLASSSGSTGSPGFLKNLSLGSIRLPAYLADRGIVMEVEPNQIVITQQNRWAEPLEEGIRRYFRQRMANPYGSSETRVDLVFDAFQSRGFDQVHASGVWLIITQGEMKPVHVHRFHLVAEIEPRDYSGIVRGMASLLDQLLEQIHQDWTP